MSIFFVYKELHVAHCGSYMVRQFISHEAFISHYSDYIGYFCTLVFTFPGTRMKITFSVAGSCAIP